MSANGHPRPAATAAARVRSCHRTTLVAPRRTSAPCADTTWASCCGTSPSAGARSRAAIAQETGLNKTTVSSLVGELIEFGLVRETEVELRGTVGRPALPVELSGHRVVGLGLEVGVDFLAVRAADLAGGERHRVLVTGDNRGRPVDDVLDQLAQSRTTRSPRSRSRTCSPPGPWSRSRAWSTATGGC